METDYTYIYILVKMEIHFKYKIDQIHNSGIQISGLVDRSFSQIHTLYL